MSTKHQVLNEEDGNDDKNRFKGEVTGLHLKDGPIDYSVRKCTDILCCILFSVFMMAVFVLGLFSFIKGQPRKLGVGYDPDRIKFSKF